MTATATPRNTNYVGPLPARGTFPMAANKRALKGTIVCVDGSGRATPGVDGEGFAAVGKASQSFLNLTTDESGGGAGAIDAEVEYGVFGWRFIDTDPEPGQVVFVVDNQTVSTDDDSGQRGIAGYCSETRDGLCYVWMGPHVAGQIVIAAAEAAQLDTAQVDIANLQADVAEGEIWVPLLNFRLAADATIPAEYVDGTDGFEVADNEALCYRFNDGSTAAIITQVELPADLDGTEDLVVHLMGARVGAADTTAALTVGAFFLVTGAAHTADSDAGGASSAFDGATTVLTEETRTIAAADVPDAGPAVLTLTLVPTAALDADDLRLFGVRITFARSIATA